MIRRQSFLRGIKRIDRKTFHPVMTTLIFQATKNSPKFSTFGGFSYEDDIFNHLTVSIH